MANGLGLGRKLSLSGPGDSGPRATASGWSRRSLPELVLIPQDLRTADPSFFAELSSGTLGLAGATAIIDDRSLFNSNPPNKEWQAALLGFGWLNDLRAANSDGADAFACRIVDEWLGLDRPVSEPDWELAVAVRRFLSWLCNGGMLTEKASPEAYDRLMAGYQDHMRRIAQLSQEAKGIDRLEADIALVTGGLCLSGQEKTLVRTIAALKAELAKQILPSGGHVSRNPGVLVELLLDLLPVKQCFMAREMKPPTWLLDTMQRMAAMLRHMQLGDRGLARFNGMGPSEIDRLATVLSYHAGAAPTPVDVASSGYVRLSRRATIIVVDGGKAPAREFSDQAHAGTLALEMSLGPWPVIVNSGAPGAPGQSWRLRSRGTAAHSTLLLNDTASAHLDGDAIIGPSQVEGKFIEPGDGAAEFQGLHNGYQHRYGMIHSRTLRLGAQGDKVSGTDRIFRSAKSGGKASEDLTYSIHFHLHPQTRVRYGAEPATALVTLPDGEIWTFSAYGSKLGLEDSLYLASFTGPTRTVQIVLRGHVLADTQIGWALERGLADPKPHLGTSD